MVMTKLGELWRELGDAKKAEYASKATADKARYDAALKAAGHLTKKELKAQKPKRPMSAYMYFSADRRSEVTAALQAELGDAFKYTAVMTKLGEEWRNADAATKSKYQDVAAKAKAE